MTIQLDEAIAVLERTPGVARALFGGLPEVWTTVDEGPETWRPIDVVGHFLIGEETDWIVRSRIILDQGESRPFDPFDRFAQFERYGGWSMGELLDRFEALRSDNLATLRSWQLTEADLARTGTHPRLGRVTLGQLIATWVAHDLDHLIQAQRAMARRYAEEVGPWTAFLGVMGDGPGG
jgi:hypothetical protein